MTDYLRPQDFWSIAQGSPFSPSSTPTHIHIYRIHVAQQETIRLVRLKLRVPPYQIWLMHAKHSQISPHSRSYI